MKHLLDWQYEWTVGRRIGRPLRRALYRARAMPQSGTRNNATESEDPAAPVRCHWLTLGEKPLP